MKQLFLFLIFISASELRAQNKKFPPDSISINVQKHFFLLFPLHDVGLTSRNPAFDTTVLLKNHVDMNGVPPLFYLDSALFFDMPFLDPANLENVAIGSGFDSVYQTNGRIYLTSKKSCKINLLSADDITAKYSINSPKNKTIWMVDNAFVKRVANFRIDSAYLYKIQLEELPAADGSAKDVPGYTIIRVYTRTAENISRFSTLRIRGSNTE